MKNKRHQENVVNKNTRCLCIVAIRYVSTPDADLRLARAIDILMRSTAKELKGSTNAEKEEEPPKDSRPEKIAGQSDGEKG